MTFRQQYDESVYVQQATLVPGLRDSPTPIANYPDYLTERPIAPERQINNGFPFVYLPQRVKSFAPAIQSVSRYVNGNFQQKVPKFKAKPIEELGVANCS